MFITLSSHIGSSVNVTRYSVSYMKYCQRLYLVCNSYQFCNIIIYSDGGNFSLLLLRYQVCLELLKCLEIDIHNTCKTSCVTLHLETLVKTAMVAFNRLGIIYNLSYIYYCKKPHLTFCDF